MREIIEKLLTTVYKSKVLRFKLDEDPLQRRIYFLSIIMLMNLVHTFLFQKVFCTV